MPVILAFGAIGTGAVDVAGFQRVKTEVMLSVMLLAVTHDS
jgi:hypothetical protein